MKTTENKIEACEKLLGELKAELLKRKETEFKAGKWIIGKNTNDGRQYIPHHPVRFIEEGDYWCRFESDKDGRTETSKKYLRHATEDEVESHLIEEAEKRGYKEGVKVKCLSEVGGTGILKNRINEYDIERDKLWHYISDGAILIYKQGKWAEIIKEKPVITFDGVEYSETTLRSIIKKATE